MDRLPPADTSDRLLAAAFDRWPRCVGLAIVRSGAIAAAVGDLDAATPVASVTKLLASLAALVAAEEGSVRLDDPAGPPGSTVRHLLAHASGLAPDTDDVLAAPGTRRIYSNAGYEELARVLERSTGIAASTYVNEGVIEALGMANTRIVGSLAHGAVSSVRDLSTWASTALAHRLVDPATWADAVTAQFPTIDGVVPGFGTQRPCPWGLGPELKGAKSPHWMGAAVSPSTFGHFGRSGSLVWVDPIRDVALVGLGRTDFGQWAVDLWPGLSDAVVALCDRLGLVCGAAVDAHVDAVAPVDVIAPDGLA